MRECQKVFFNLKSALVKIEKQRKVFLRKQKPILTTTSSMLKIEQFFFSIYELMIKTELLRLCRLFNN